MTLDAARPEATGRSPWPLVRWSAFAAVLGFVAWRFVAYGIPLDRNTLFGYAVLLAAPLVWRGRGLSVLRLVVDWLALGVVLALYDVTRHAALKLDLPISLHLAPDLDRAVFGQIPTLWLQHRLYATSPDHWYDIPFSLLYGSHFVVPIVTFAVLYVRSRRRFYAYELRFVLLTAVALLLYLAHPTAPPWLDGDVHVIGHVHRTALYGFRLMHVHLAQALLSDGLKTSNIVAAFPSLHAGYTMLLAAFLWSRVRWWWRAVLAAYVAGMGFMLVATGEHWVSDVVAGWLLAIAAHVVVCRWEARRAQG